MYEYTYLCIEFVITHNFQTMIPKHVLYLLIICISCTLATCSSSPDEGVKAKLAQAENIMYSAPDSALQLLEHLQPPKEKEQRATWALLLAQARYKNYIKQTDSLVNTAYDYFKKTDEPASIALALYIKGGIKYEEGAIEEAQKIYLRAKDESDKTQDTQIKYLININIGNMYAFRGLKEEALSAYNDAHNHAIRLHNIDYTISALIGLARTYSIEPADYPKAISYYNEAALLAGNTSNNLKKGSIIGELAHIYGEMGDFKTALAIAKEELKLQEEKHALPSNYYLNLGIIYKEMEETDSAYYYLQKTVAATNDIRVKGDAYRHMYEINKQKELYAKALYCCEQYLMCIDSILNKDKRHELAEMQAKYDQQKVIIERNELQLKKEHMTRNYLFISIIIAIIGGIIIGMYQRALVKKEKLLKKQEDAMQQAKLKMNENEFIIKRNKQKIAELDLQIKASNEIKELLEEQRTAQKELQQQNQSLIDENILLQRKMEQYSLANEVHSNTLQELNKLIIRNKYLHERELFLSECLVKTNPILNKVKTKHAYIEDIQWKQLKEELNLIFDNYIERLLKLAPSISERELHLSCLIKLKMSNIDMGDALGISPSSVAKLKQRLKDRLSTEIPSFDKSMLLDVWLWDF